MEDLERFLHMRKYRNTDLFKKTVEGINEGGSGHAVEPVCGKRHFDAKEKKWLSRLKPFHFSIIGVYTAEILV